MTEHKEVEPVGIVTGLSITNNPRDFEWFKPVALGAKLYVIEPNTTAIPTSEYKQLKADAERWRHWIETASGEAAFELTGITDASNEQINEAIDQARGKA